MKTLKKTATPKILIFDSMLPVPKLSLFDARGNSQDSSSNAIVTRLNISMYRIADRCTQRATVLRVGSRV